MQEFTCLLNTKTTEIVYYTHVAPLCGVIFLSIYLLIKTNKSILSRSFFYFVISFCAWLILDLVAWLPFDYKTISFAWSLFDYLNVVFFLFGMYFFIVFIREREIRWQWRLFGVLLTLFPLYRIISGYSIQYFNQQACEALSDPLIYVYKIGIEILVIVGIIYLLLSGISSRTKAENHRQVIIVATSLLIFFITFGITDYLSVQSEIYEIGLYGLFILPIFLGLIVYAIVAHKAFSVEMIKAQVLIISLTFLVCSQFFFMQSAISRVISSVTFLIVIIFGKYLIVEVKKDIENQRQLQFAYNHFKELEGIKSQFISFGTHQILNPLTVIKGYVSMLQEENYGTFTNKVTEVFSNIKQTTDRLETNIRSYFDLPKFTYHKVAYDFSEAKVVEMITIITSMYKRALRNEVDVFFENKSERSDLLILADETSLREAFSNIIENCLKYTKASSISVDLTTHEGCIVVKVVCIGERRFPKIVPDILKEIKNDDKISYNHQIISSDLGLYIAKEIIELHKGNLDINYSKDDCITNFKIHLPLLPTPF